MLSRLPKPLHGWRQFAGEVGVIVLGVLIALGAQQVVEAINQREAVAQLRRAFRAELADDRGRWENMRASDPCTLQRLHALDRWAATAPAGARLERAYRLLLWNMHSSAWDIAKTSPATAHMPLEERLTYSDLYAAIDNWREYLGEERVNAVELSRARSLAPTSRTAGGRSRSTSPRPASSCAAGRRITPIFSSVSTSSTSAPISVS